MAEFNLFDLLRKAKKPFEGVGETFGELNVLGSSVPESFKQLRDAGLLSKQDYTDAVSKADKRGKRNAFIKGLLRFGLQDFDKNVGSAFNPVYLKSPLLSAVDASQKSYDQLTPNFINKIKLTDMKKDIDQKNSVKNILDKGLYDSDTNTFNATIVNDLIKTGDITTANAIDSMIARNKAAIKTLADTHERKVGLGNEIYYIPKQEGTRGVYKLGKNGQPILTERFVQKPDLRSVGEGGLIDVSDPANAKQVVEGVRSPARVKQVSNAEVKEIRRLVPKLYTNKEVSLGNDEARVIANEVATRRANDTENRSTNDLVMEVIKEFNFLQKADGFKGTFDIFDPNYKIVIPDEFGTSGKKRKNINEY